MELEHLPLVQGKGKYVDDIKVESLYLGMIRSPYPRARIVRILRPEKARFFFTNVDLPAYLPIVAPKEAKVVRMPVFAESVVNFVGQPVAAVVANSPEEVEDLIEETNVEYEELEPSTELIDPKIEIHAGVSKNISFKTKVKGGNQNEFSHADIEVEREITMERVVANPMETKGILAYYDGMLRVFVSAQTVFRIRRELSQVLNIPPEKIEVNVPDVGGGFGNKVPLHAEYAITAFAAIKTGKPVKWIETRTEHLNNPTQGKGVYAKVKLYGRRTGEIIGFKGTVINDLGAYNYTINTTTASFIASLITGPYQVKAVEIDAISVFTNRPPTGPYRGAGRPEAALIHESLIEDFAEEVKMDSIQVRRINVIKGPYNTPTGLSIDRAGYQEVLETAGEVLRSRGGAIAFFSEQTRGLPGESAKIRLKGDEVEVIVGSRNHGQGHATVFRKLVSQVLGIPEAKVKVRPANSPDLKDGIGSFGSRSVIAGGSAVIEASLKLREKIGELSVEEAFKRLGPIDIEVFKEVPDIFSPGAHVTEVEVDPETCIPRVKYYFAVDDIGKVINFDDAKGQVIGGVIQGISEVLWEWARYDKNGNPQFSSIADEGVPTPVEVPEVLSKFVEFPSSLPHGARGIGEGGTIGGMVATFIALEKKTKKKFKRIPILPEDICL
ncbi:aldehyde oxidase [Sulfolobales archaeon HS-7]|nr:aldehyde oxidase [Sulfolobales archaeon HS-7]